LEVDDADEVENYISNMVKIEMDDYVVNDYHVNSQKFGLGKFAEEGALVIDEYLDFDDMSQEKKKFYIKEKKIKTENINKVILGCTHYPILLPKMKNFLGKNVEIMDSGSHVAKLIKRSMLIKKNKQTSNVKYYVTDLPERFKKYGSIFLGSKINEARIVKI